ncbi:MAG TPA: 4Fe-4S ferredoxin, partial [Xanthobacteraceae bacterium]
MAEDRIVLLCSCEDTMPLAAGAVGKACGGADVRTGRQLCRAELERFRAAAASGKPVTVACTQEAPLFAEVAGEAAGGLSFVNIRETAGWSKDS